MKVRRKPASRAPVPQRRPAAQDPELPVTRFHYLKELAAVQLRTLGLIELGDAHYYEGHVKVAGFIMGLGRDEDFLEFRVTGTQTERLVEMLSDPAKRTMQLHICQTNCSWQPTGEDVLHAAGYWVVGDQKLPWHSLLEEHPKKSAEVDELARLRALHEERQAEGAGEKPSPSQGSEKKKKKDKKRKKKSKGKEKKTGKGRAGKKEDGEDEDSEQLERGQKSLSALYGNTCLDPDAEVRSKLLKRAKRFGSKESKKRKHSSSDDDSDSSETSESEMEEYGEGLFEERRKALRLTQRYPGSLTTQTVMNMKESLLTQSGTLYSQDRKALPPIFSRYFRSGMQPLCSPSMSQELLTLCQGADLLLRGHPARALDLLAQRVKALEQQIHGGHWTVARQLELVSADASGLSKGTEGAEAAKLAREELRNRIQAQRPYGSGGREKGDIGGKGKDRQPPVGDKGKGEKGKRDKGKEKRKMSSVRKKRKRSFNRGEKIDPELEGAEKDERGLLVGRTLADTLGIDEDEGIEQLLRDSAEKGLRLRQDREGLEVEKKRSSDMQVLPGWLEKQDDRLTGQDPDKEQVAEESLKRESSISQCRTEGCFPPGGIGRVACMEHVEKGRGTEDQLSQTRLQTSERPTFMLSREEKADMPEASWRQAFEDCRLNLAKVCRKKGAIFGELGDVVSEALKGQEVGFLRCSQATGDLFPLPLPSSLSRSHKTPPCVDALVQALNSLYGTKTVLRTREDKTRIALVDRLEKVVVNSGLAQEVLPDMDFEKFFECKGVDYSGEEVQVARRFRWHMVEAAFPEAVGSLDLEEFCEGGTLEYVRNFESFMLPVEDQYVGKTPSIMVELEHWSQVCSGLLRRGVCRAMHVSEIHHVGGKPLLNGLFAVGKNETAIDEEGEEFEVCRLIMNLVPTNSCCRSLTGDTSTLPSVVGMSSIVLEDHQLLVTSSEDIRCFFYLFRTPPSYPLRLSQQAVLVPGGIWSLRCCQWGLLTRWPLLSTYTAG